MWMRYLGIRTAREILMYQTCSLFNRSMIFTWFLMLSKIKRDANFLLAVNQSPTLNNYSSLMKDTSESEPSLKDTSLMMVMSWIPDGFCSRERPSLFNSVTRFELI